MKVETAEIVVIEEHRERVNSDFEEKPKPVAYIAEDQVLFRRTTFRTLYEWSHDSTCCPHSGQEPDSVPVRL